jgi:hypothetical protein
LAFTGSNTIEPVTDQPTGVVVKGITVADTNNIEPQKVDRSRSNVGYSRKPRVKG